MNEQQARTIAKQIARRYPAIDAQVTRPKQMKPGSTMHYVELTLRAQRRRFTCRWPRQVNAALFAWAVFLDEHEASSRQISTASR